MVLFGKVVGLLRSSLAPSGNRTLEADIRALVYRYGGTVLFIQEAADGSGTYVAVDGLTGATTNPTDGTKTFRGEVGALVTAYGGSLASVGATYRLRAADIKEAGA